MSMSEFIKNASAMRRKLDPTPIVVTASNYTLSYAVNGRIIEFTNPCVIILPATIKADFACALCNASVGAVTVQEAVGAFWRQKDSVRGIGGQWAEASVRVRANVGGNAAEWVGSGAFI